MNETVRGLFFGITASQMFFRNVTTRVGGSGIYSVLWQRSSQGCVERPCPCFTVQLFDGVNSICVLFSVRFFRRLPFSRGYHRCL